MDHPSHPDYIQVGNYILFKNDGMIARLRAEHILNSDADTYYCYTVAIDKRHICLLRYLSGSERTYLALLRENGAGLIWGDAVSIESNMGDLILPNSVLTSLVSLARDGWDRGMGRTIFGA